MTRMQTQVVTAYEMLPDIEPHLTQCELPMRIRNSKGEVVRIVWVTDPRYKRAELFNAENPGLTAEVGW